MSIGGLAFYAESYVASLVLSLIQFYTKVVGIVYEVEGVGVSVLGDAGFLMGDEVPILTEFASSSLVIEVAVGDGVVVGSCCLEENQEGQQAQKYLTSHSRINVDY